MMSSQSASRCCIFVTQNIHSRCHTVCSDARVLLIDHFPPEPDPAFSMLSTVPPVHFTDFKRNELRSEQSVVHFERLLVGVSGMSYEWSQAQAEIRKVITLGFRAHALRITPQLRGM